MVFRHGAYGFALMSLLGGATAHPQETTGTLEGRAIDVAGRPDGDVVVTVSGPSLQGSRDVSTSEDGSFVVLVLPVGVYSLRLTSPAGTEQTVGGVRVQLGQTTSLGDVQVAGPVRWREEVAVSGRAPLIDPASSFQGANLLAQDYAALPVDRDYRSLLTLLPQANQSFLGDAVNLAGSTGLENRYFVDGIDMTDPNRNVTASALPYNFVEEVQVRTGGYQAEHRSSLGGVVNVVTYSGGNDVHGQFFGFFANNSFTASRRLGALEPAKGDFARFDVGLGLGGPILRDRLWYYGAYSPAFEHQEIEVPGQGFFPDRSTTHRFSGKLTWRATPRHTLTFTTIGDPTRRDGVGTYWSGSYTPAAALANPDPYLIGIRTGGVGFLVEGQHLLGHSLLIKSALSRMSREDVYAPATPRGRAETLFIDTETGLWSGGAQDDVDSQSVVTTAGATATWLQGAHLAKAGLEYRDNRWDFDIAQHFVQRYSDAAYFEFVGAFRGRVRNRVLSAFLQDSWRLTPRLRLNAGLRWDGQYIVSSEGKVAQTILDEWQPRVGVTWQPGEEATQKVTASFGRFYQELPTYPLYFYYNAGNRLDFTSYDHDPRVDATGGETMSLPSTIQAEIHGMEGQCFDELALAYERRLGKSAKLALGGVHRSLRQGLEDGQDPVTGEWQFGNPGREKLGAFPRVRRTYDALQATFQRTGKGVAVLASYVLSRARGNYPGLFNSDFDWALPNANGSFDVVETLVNGDGLLPNDRTHVVKLAGHYASPTGLTVGAVGLWETGTPLSEIGGAVAGPPYWTFLYQRGTAGRTPSLWDVNLRLAYAPSFAARDRWRPRLIVDALHLASQRRPVAFDQVHYFNVDAGGNQIDPNPTYGLATRFQPPMALRLGLEVSF
jgi:hypothetical protein